jgi:hypothetical protein
LFDDPQPRKSAISLTIPAIVLACGVGAMVLGFGLCGAFGMAGQGGLRAIGNVALILFFVGLVAVVVGFVWLIIAAIVSAVRG